MTKTVQSEAATSGLWSTERVAQFLDYSEKQVRNLHRAGKLPPALRIGGRDLRWRAADIIAFVSQKAAA